MKKIKVISPATAANLGPGYDVFGLALKEPHDEIEVEVTDDGKITIECSGYQVPTQPTKNSGGYAAMRMLERFGIKDGIRIKCHKNVPPAMGLGSSSASAAGVVYCINKLFDLNLSTTELIQAASYGEIISAGDMHADNVAAAIQGGFSVVVSREPLYVIHLDPPENMGVVVVIPHKIEKGSTRITREAVPRDTPIGNLRENVGHASLLAMGMASKNLDFIKKGMFDAVVEPARIRYGVFRELPKLREIGEELNAGIAGCGDGPSIIGVIEKNRTKELAAKMKEEFDSKNYPCEVIITEVGEGVKEI